jgi:hypothetical protein
MQDTGHEAVVAYRKCPATQQIQQKKGGSLLDLK